MQLVKDHTDTETPAEALVRESRRLLGEYANTTMLVYGNLMNHQHNNAQNVSKAEFTKALGKEAKDFDYVMGAMKRLLLKLNPALKDQLNAMAPKKSKKPRA